MAAYIPFAGKNSIVEVVFGLIFAQPLVSTIDNQFDALKAAFIGDFPSFEKMQMIQMTFGPQSDAGILPSASVVGINAIRFKPDGKPSRVFRGVNNTLSVHFLEYENWAETKAKGLEFLLRCVRLLSVPSDQNSITGITLRFIDRFTFDGPTEAASAAPLLRSNTEFVPQHILNVGSTWNSNAAWQDLLMDQQAAQHQLSVNGGVDTNAFVMINHNVHCNLASPLVSLEEMKGPTKPTLEKIFDAEHKANVALLKNLVEDKTLNIIGLS